MCAVVYLLGTEHVLGWMLPGSAGATLQSFWLFGCCGSGTLTQLLVRRTAAVTEGCVCVSTRNISVGGGPLLSPFSGLVGAGYESRSSWCAADIASTCGHSSDIHRWEVRDSLHMSANVYLTLQEFIVGCCLWAQLIPHTAWATMGLIMDHYHEPHQELLATASDPKDQAENIHPHCRWAF